MKEINGDALFNLIAGHSDYHGNDILCAIKVMQEGKEPKHIKPIDIASAVHGHWITHNHNNPFEIYGECSECGLEQSLSESLPYCPNCGAKMDEVSE